MENSATAKHPELYLRIAHPIHTVAVLIAIGVTALRGAMRADQMRSAVNLDRIRLYERTMLFEWGVLALVLLFRKLSSSGSSLPLTADWIEELSIDCYRPMLRLLDGEEAHRVSCLR